MKKVRKFVLFLAVISIIPSCELLDDCKTCSLVTYVEGVYDSKTEGVLYCGDELKAKEKELPAISGNQRTQWECY